MSKHVKLIFWALKVVTAGYWAWVLGTMLFARDGSFSTILIHSAPLVLGMHFMQLMVFMRVLKRQPGYGAQVAQVMLFGVFHVAPLMLELGTKPSPKR